jgi:hypothetical protein
MATTPILPAGFQPEAHHVAGVITAAQAMLDAFGGDTPDWLEGEAAALQSALGSYWAQREKVTAAPTAYCARCGAPASEPHETPCITFGGQG